MTGATGEMAPQRCLKAGDGHLVGTERPGERVLAARVDRFRRPEQDSRLGSSEQLVPGKNDEVRSGRDAVGEVRFVSGSLHSELGQRLEIAAPEILDHRNSELGPQRDQFGRGRGLGETDDPEIGLMDLEERSRPAAALADGAPVVVDAGAIRRSHFDEPGPALRQDVRNPEGISDLDQFPAGNDDVLSGRQGVERQQDPAGGVSGDSRSPSGKHGFEQAGEVLLAAPAGAGSEIELKVRITARGPEDRLGGAVGQRCSSQVGVNDDAGRVDHPPEVGPGGAIEPRLHLGSEPGFRVAGEAGRDGPRAHGPPKLRDLGSESGGNEPSAKGIGKRPEAGCLEKPSHGGKLREGCLRAFGHGIRAARCGDHEATLKSTHQMATPC